MRKKFVFIILLMAITIANMKIFILTAQSNPTAFPKNDHVEKILKQTKIEQEARLLEKEGRYNEAIAKYREATNPELLNYDYEAGVAIGGIERIYQKQGEFDLALRELNWHLQRNPEKYLDEKLELEALIKARNTKSSQPVVEHIEYLKKKYKNQLPPKSCGGMCDSVFSGIVRLYDHIGNCDAGIEFANSFLRFYKKIGPGNPYQPGNQYFQIKQAFEEDKKEGFKGCLNAKPGDACMGRATKALIQSDYFPW